MSDPAHLPTDANAPPARPAWHRLRDIAIGAILLVVVIEAMPGVPSQIRSYVDPWARAVGFDQDQWLMFAPTPDRQNHRIFVTIEYADGSRREWRPPEWRDQSRWERFVTHRQSKFAENIANPGHLVAIPSTARWIEREIARGDDPPQARPVRARFWTEEAKVPDPMYFPWPSVRERHDFETKWQFGEYDFPQDTSRESQP